MMKRLLVLTSALLLSSAAIAVAAPSPTIELVPSGTSFSVMANNFTKVGGFEMVIQYNPLALQSPKVSSGEMIVGGTFIPNVTHSRSTVKIVLSNAFKSIDGSGKLATVSFTPVPGGASKGNVNIVDDGYLFTSSDAKKTVTVKLISSFEQNQGRLDNNAIVACLNDSQNCTATVQPDGTVSLMYKDKTPVNGLCGPTSGTTVSTKPSANLCSDGTPSALSGNGPWYWKCDGVNGGASAGCYATKTPEAVNGMCGISISGSFSSSPTDNLCSAGIASTVKESDLWTWSCLGINDGATASCSAKKNTNKIDGLCGSANGVSTSSKPVQLCSSGTPSEVTESGGLWSWSCSGVNGGAPVNCSAPTPATLSNQFANQTGQTPSIAFVSLPPDPTASSDKKPDYQPLVTDLRKDMTLPVGGTETAAASSGQKPAEKAKETESKFVKHKAALQFFAEYKGDRNPKNLIVLFAEPSIPSFSQDPPIALADGKGVVKIKLLVNTSSSELPKFIMQGATVKKLPKQGEDGFWSIEALPKKDAYEAKLTVIDGERMLEFPLTVVPVTLPVLGKDKKFSEADFARFLAKPSRFDLNGDKKFDYVDDYIYTANYIVALKIKPEKPKKTDPRSTEADKKKEQPKLKEKGQDGAEKILPKPTESLKKPVN